jgi:peptidoglycan/LPS O-acetylase OafA/YrhL
VLPVTDLPALHGSLVPGYAVSVALAFAVSIIAALVSWWVIEAPFLSLKRFVPYINDRSPITPGAAAMVPEGQAA